MTSLYLPSRGDKRYGPYKKAEKYIDDNNSELIKDDDGGVDIENVTVAENPHAKLCLWALEITFPHPKHGGDVNVKINEPEWYKELRDDQEKKWQDKFV